MRLATQICKFVQEKIESVVQSVSVQDVVSGKVKMPFVNEAAWRSAQQDCQILKRAILDGLISALHLQFGHPSKSQLNQVFDRYFYAICSSDAIKAAFDKCGFCNSLKRIPNVGTTVISVITI